MIDINLIRKEFKKYLYEQVANNKLSKIDADTQYSDANYPRKHANELGINYWNSFKSKDDLEKLIVILKEQFEKKGKNPTTINSYKRALKNFMNFIEEQYGGVDNLPHDLSKHYYWVNQGKEYPNNINYIQASNDNIEGHKLVQNIKIGDKILSYVRKKGGIFRELTAISEPEKFKSGNKELYRVKVDEKIFAKAISLSDIQNLNIDISKIKSKNIPWNKDYKKVKQNRYLVEIHENIYNLIKNEILNMEQIIMNEVNCKYSLNQILYGPPGTGKTYNTVIKAMSIINNTEDKNVSDEKYKVLKTKFDEYKQAGQIEFVTFHQSYSYEEFVEGIKPDLDTESWNEPVDKLTYKGANGVFKTIANKALFDRLNIEKGQQEAILDFKNLKELFVEEYSVGSIFKTGTKNAEFRIDKYTKDIARITPINGKYTYSITFKYLEEAYNKKMSSQSEIATINGVASGLSCYYYAIYEKLLNIKKSSNVDNVKINVNEMLDEDKLQLVKDYYNGKIEINKDIKSKPYVLIIDEINRGNISKIFGELITLIEEDKRENLSVKLPYSQELFTVPKNLYIIGTMNTSDRSIASIDIALRRRFNFKEMMPNTNLVAGFYCNFKKCFEILNKRISVLLDRDHQIGHSYFIETKHKNDGIDELKDIWFNNILPLLNEYFYGDWEKLQALLGPAKNDNTSFIKKNDKISFANDYSCDEDENYDFVSEAESDFELAMENAFGDNFKVQ